MLFQWTKCLLRCVQTWKSGIFIIYYQLLLINICDMPQVWTNQPSLSWKLPERVLKQRSEMHRWRRLEGRKGFISDCAAATLREMASSDWWLRSSVNSFLTSIMLGREAGLWLQQLVITDSSSSMILPSAVEERSAFRSSIASVSGRSPRLTDST